jgi:hypothetical protein
MRSMVEGRTSNAKGARPSTTLQVVPLPVPGRI